MENDFRDFLIDLLRRGKIKDKFIEKLLTPENMAEFTIAFTHPSAGYEKDYQLYEFLGDPVINEFVPFYLRERFPKIISVKWITRLKHNLISKKYLAMLARNIGIDKFAIYGDAPFSISEGRAPDGMNAEIQKNPDLAKNMFYLSMLEDIMEAFCGCVVILVTEKLHKAHGVATEICKNILRSLFDPVEIQIKYSEVFDAVSRLKELYESKIKALRWPNKDTYKTLRDGELFEIVVYGWPKGDKQPIDANRIELARAKSVNKKHAKEEAASKAIELLDRKWGIKIDPPNPYEK